MPLISLFLLLLLLLLLAAPACTAVVYEYTQAGIRKQSRRMYEYSFVLL